MRSALAATAILLTGVAGTAAGMTLMALSPEPLPVGFRFEDSARFLLMQASLTFVGALLVWRRPQNRIGWLLSAAALLSAGQYVGAGYATYGLLGGGSLPRADIAAWFYTWSGGWLGIPIGLVVLTFPDGRLRLRRARVGATLAFVASALTAGSLALQPGPLLNFRVIDNPFGVTALADALTPLLVATVITFVAAIGMALSALWERFRVATGDERQQLKWILAAAGLMGGALPIGFPLVFVDWELAKFLFSVFMSTIPLSIGIAILRYRLYDIDVLINRTLVYGLTTAAIAISFFGGIVVLQTPLRALTGGSELAVAISTLASFALFQPLRARIQTGVDRRFYRARYDAARTLDEFSGRLRDEVDLDAVRTDLLSAVRDTMRPAHASVWLRERAR
jgi:hypothetical protein